MGNATDEKIAQRWQQLVLAEKDDRLRRNIGAVAKVFLELNDKPQVWESVMEGWNVIKSPFLESIRADGRADGAAALRQALYSTLEQIMRANTPEDIRRQVEKETDLTTLSKWCGDAFRCTTWDAVRALIGLTAN